MLEKTIDLDHLTLEAKRMEMLQGLLRIVISCIDDNMATKEDLAIEVLELLERSGFHEGVNINSILVNVKKDRTV